MLDGHEFNREDGVPQQREIRLHRSQPGRHGLAEPEIGDETAEYEQDEVVGAELAVPDAEHDQIEKAVARQQQRGIERIPQHPENGARIFSPALDHRQRPQHMPGPAKVREQRLHLGQDD